MPVKTDFTVSIKLGIGQYAATGSFFHRLDPRVKIIIGVVLIGTAVAGNSLFGLGVLLLLLWFSLLVSRVHVRLAFITLIKMMPYLIILALIQIFTIRPSGATVVLWHWWILTVTDQGLISGGLLILRFSVIMLGLSLFSSTTSTNELLHGIEHLLRPLQKMRFPSHELALIANISIRFIPILAEEAEKLMKAQASRGADFGMGRMGFIKRMRRMFPLFIPLFVQSLKHAYRLVEAMEARCYTGGRGRTSFISLHAETRDFVALALGIVIIGGVLTAGFFHIDSVVWNMSVLVLR
jgi:energy-coupling factor transport system permease protein